MRATLPLRPGSRMWHARRREWLVVRADEVKKGDQLANHGTITASRPAKASDSTRPDPVKVNGVPVPLAQCWFWAAGPGYSGICDRDSPIVVGRLPHPAARRP